MNKFLHAMGITLWRPKVGTGAPALLLLADDDHSLLQHPLVTTVLTLLGTAPEACQVISKVDAGAEVLWCFGHSDEEVDAMISTPTIAELQQSSQAKRALWQQLWPHLDGVQ